MMLPLLQSKDQSDLLNAIFLSPSTTQSEQQVFNKNMLTPPPPETTAGIDKWREGKIR